MALTQGARNKINSAVQAAKKLLMAEFESQLQQYYGIRPDGSSLMVEELTSRDASIIETARLLRQRLHYLEEGIAEKNKAPEAVRQLIREQAFTVLNRFAALRMAEERGIIPDSICKGYNSDGFRVYDQLTGEAKTADQFTRYRWYITHIFDELAIDLPAVFDRYSPYSLLFPSERVVLELLDIINDKEFIIYREEGVQPINLWKSDETIGWMYQYYNSRDEISEMRDASGAPRNSRELAVRNQFFTPRYVVEFLVDNSLGRQWYEMTKGKTSLKDFCQYMVIKEQEVFLEKDASIPEVKIDGANYIEYRPLKDPREILMLDPACGSMHFGLYSFDLFEQIYLEAWDMYPELMQDLREQYMRDDFIKHIPSMILRYNIHGVDIDPRAIQIAGLSLWLRAQRTYNNLNLEPADRPAISKSNLVVAEPMPGDEKLLSDFTNTLPPAIGKLVKAIWEKMQLVGEMGLLLKIEEELKKEIEIAKKEYKEYKNKSAQGTLFDTPAESKIAEMAAIYGKEQKISKDFFDTAEEEVLKALKTFAEGAEGEDAFQKLLFAEDTARGFAFIELSRKRYDVIVMNPPFGASSIATGSYYNAVYPKSKMDLYSIFIERNNSLLINNGMTAQITNRTGFFLSSFSKWRKDFILENYSISFFLDLGSGVLDALVETAAYILEKNKSDSQSIFIDLLQSSFDKSSELKRAINGEGNNVYILNTTIFNNLPMSNFAYWLSDSLFKIIKNNPKFECPEREARIGLSTGDDFRFIRSWCEIPNYNSRWKPLTKGGAYSPYYSDIYLAINWYDDGSEIRNFRDNKGKLRSRPQNLSYFFKPGITWSLRTSSNLSFRYLPGGVIFSHKGPTFFTPNNWYWLGVAQSSLFQELVSIQLAAGDTAARSYETGVIQSTPVPFNEKSAIINGRVSEIVKEIYQLRRNQDIYNEYSKAFVVPYLIENYNGNIAKDIESYNSIEINLNNRIEKLHFQLDSLINEAYDIDFDVEQKTHFKTPKHDVKDEILKLFSWAIGVSFLRWDVDYALGLKEIPKYNLNASFQEQPVTKLDEISINNNSLFTSILNNYIGNFQNEFIEDSSLSNMIYEILKSIFTDRFENLIYDIYQILGINNLEDVNKNLRLFFQFHLSEYSISRRIAPIYWPISTASNSYKIWIYYPKLNEGSLYKIINELVDPKIKEVAKSVEVLEFGGSGKEYNEQKELLNELYIFKEEILRVAQLPYKPNQDDGVLITAAPLHNLFQHTKWRRDTEKCWKELEKGDYDWAHLAYSIWPERVHEKCKKDLSMAIAHGLEDICEVKPKETKKRGPSQLKIK